MSDQNSQDPRQDGENRGEAKNAWDDRTLWTTAGGQRFFLIPDGLELPGGDLALETATRRIEVDPAAAAPFEVTAAEADAWIESAGRRAFEHARDTVQELWSEAKAAFKRRMDASSQPGQASTATGLLSSLLGISSDELRRDGEAVAAGLRSVAQGAVEVVLSAVSSDPLTTEKAHARLFALREALRAQGIDPGEDLENLPDRWRAAWQSEEVERSLRDGAARLEELAARAHGQSEALERTLRDGVAELLGLADRVHEARTGSDDGAGGEPETGAGTTEKEPA